MQPDQTKPLPSGLWHLVKPDINITKNLLKDEHDKNLKGTAGKRGSACFMPAKTQPKPKEFSQGFLGCGEPAS